VVKDTGSPLSKRQTSSEEDATRTIVREFRYA
jgi:hypothetical protein